MNTKFDCDIVNGLSNAVCGRIDLLEKMLGVKVRENLRYSDIQKIVKSGLASEFFDIGDEIMTTYTATDGTEYDFPWLVVDFRDVYWENDPDPHPGMVLQAKYATAENIQFDGPENTPVDSETEPKAQEGWYYFGRVTQYTLHKLDLNPGDDIPFTSYSAIYKCIFNSTSICIGGYNNYKMSAIRQWLNSDADVGEWWAPTHLGDLAPSSLNVVKGFMSELSSDFIEVLKPTKIQQLFPDNVDVMYDKFFLPSYEELYGVHNNDINHVEGPCFQYWKEKTGFNSPSNSANTGRIVTAINGQMTAPVCWTRTMDARDLKQVWLHVVTAGSLNGGGDANADTFRVLPCCVIS